MNGDTKPKILIADDEEDICDFLSFSFETNGFHVFTAKDTDKAFDILKRVPGISAVISDIRMPGGGGMRLLELIRGLPNPKPPVFLITGFSDVTLDEALAAGAEAIIAKPFNLNSLLQTIKGRLELA